MINAWSLLWEEINGTMDETYPIKENGMSGISTDGNEGKSKYWFDYDRNDPDAENPFDTLNLNFTSETGSDSINLNFSSIAGADTVAISGVTEYGGVGEDHIYLSGGGNTAYDELSMDNYFADGYNPILPEYDWEVNQKPRPDFEGSSFRKYQEDKSMKDLSDYVSSTYQGHYTNENSDVQTLDLIHSVGDAESFCRSNALKYLSRYDKKGQAKRDILKAMHYCLLLYYFSGQTNETPTRGYETF